MIYFAPLLIATKILSPGCQEAIEVWNECVEEKQDSFECLFKNYREVDRKLCQTNSERPIIHIEEEKKWDLMSFENALGYLKSNKRLPEESECKRNRLLKRNGAVFLLAVSLLASIAIRVLIPILISSIFICTYTAILIPVSILKSARNFVQGKKQTLISDISSIKEFFQ